MTVGRQLLHESCVGLRAWPDLSDQMQGCCWVQALICSKSLSVIMSAVQVLREHCQSKKDCIKQFLHAIK